MVTAQGKIGTQIKRLALELLQQRPDGIRYSQLVQLISEKDRRLNLHTIRANIWNLDAIFPKRVCKPSRGLFRLVEFGDKGPSNPEKELGSGKIKEEEFYSPFADWLVNEIEDCTKAIALGGNVFMDKWRTPDVIGKRASKPSDVIKIETEIVTAEIKLNIDELVTAFGQACAYGLYSHKSYLVIHQK